MKARLTTEQSDLLNRSGAPLSFVDPKTQNVYVLMDEFVYQQAMLVLQWQREEDEVAVQKGLDDMHAGRGMTLDESRNRNSDAISRLSQ